VADHRVFAQVDVQHVLDLVRECVLGGEPASVVRGSLPVPLHPPLADAAPQGAAQRVRVLPADGLCAAGAVERPSTLRLNPLRTRQLATAGRTTQLGDDFTVSAIPGGLGRPSGTDCGGVRGCERVHPAPVDVEDRAVDEGGLV
jgi:hypothetical protein